MSPAFAGDAQVWIYPYEGSTPLVDASIAIGSQPASLSGTQGAVGATLPPGTHEVRVSRAGTLVAAFPIEVTDDEQVRIALSLTPGRAPAYTRSSDRAASRTVVLQQADDRSTATPAGETAPGVPAAAAAPGVTEAVSSVEAGRTPRSLQGVTVEQGVEADEAGSEFQLAVERREATQVIDTLSIEQISRAGDSDAAAALKRVTGLSLVDDRFIYVRGLGERYSSVLLNGAQIPSPDPTRRVVPLDLFPTEVLQAITVQKTWSPGLPAEFGGGTVQLRTRGAPGARLGRLQGSIGYVDGTTGESGLRSQGGSRDWLGRDDGSRDAPDGLFQRPLPPTGTESLRTLGSALAEKGFGVGRKDIGPDTGFAAAFGNDFGDAEQGFGFIGSLRYAQAWDHRHEQRAEFSTDGRGDLIATQDYVRERSERSIDTSLFLTAGARLGEDHALRATAMRLRQTEQEESLDEGLRGSGNVERNTRSEWTENQLDVLQLGGEHAFGADSPTLDWQYTDSTARRDLPFARSFLYAQAGDGDFIYTSSFPLQLRYEFLDDTAREAQLELRHAFAWSDTQALSLRAGGSRLRRDRDSEIWRYTFRNTQSLPQVPVAIDDLINPGSIEAGRFELVGLSSATDFYTAAQRLDALHLSGDLQLQDWHLDLGARYEQNEQHVVTQNPFLPGAPVQARIDASDLLPAVTATWRYSDAGQWRLGYNETLSRPEFRELSAAPYTDPLLDITVFGNPALRQTSIRSLDLRWEYWFSDLESFSVGVFHKQFDDPIELVRTPASADLLTLRNAQAADSRGIEFDLATGLGALEDARWLPLPLRASVWQDLSLALNYTWIDSEVDLGDASGIQTSSRRPLQGQSKWLGNLALTWFDPDGDGDATLLYAVAGERISRVGESGIPDEYEQPFHQLDLTWSRRLGDDWKVKLRLRNLLDPKVEYTQGHEVSRHYRKGRELALGFEWTF